MSIFYIVTFDYGHGNPIGPEITLDLKVLYEEAKSTNVVLFSEKQV